jgi:beta-lactamase regulating signal transducer with metallopeptidase domain
MNWPVFFLDLALRGLLISSVAAFAVWKLCGRKRTVAAAFGLCALLALPFAQFIPRWEVTMPATATAVSALAAATASWKLPVAVWGIGFILIAARLVPGWLRLSQWRNASTRVTNIRLLAETKIAAETLGMSLPPEVRLASFRVMPAAFGIRRGTVFLPEEALKWPTEQLRMVLLHELAHLKRRDPGMQALACLTCALHWFNPLVWVLHRIWLKEREVACDALVLSTGVAPKGYALHLLDIAQRFRNLTPRPLLSAAMAGSGLEQRVRHIMAWVPGSAPRRKGMAIAVMVTAAGLVTAAATLLPRPKAPLPGTPQEQEVTTRLLADPFPATP